MRITGGFLKNHPLETPKGSTTRPTSEKLRQSVFNICQHLTDQGDFLDLFSGSGAMGIEAISRGASSATFIENNPAALKTLRENLQNLDISPLANVLAGDVLTLLKKLKGKTYHLIFVDPPYEKGFQEKTLALIDTYELLHIGGIIFIEESANHPLEIPEMKHLELSKKRKMGSTELYQFIGNCCYSP